MAKHIYTGYDWREMSRDEIAIMDISKVKGTTPIDPQAGDIIIVPNEPKVNKGYIGFNELAEKMEVLGFDLLQHADSALTYVFWKSDKERSALGSINRDTSTFEIYNARDWLIEFHEMELYYLAIELLEEFAGITE